MPLLHPATDGRSIRLRPVIDFSWRLEMESHHGGRA
jgi:hypothetical protein